jgi:hypothetical protein
MTALLTGANSGVLTTVAWSSAFDSRLIEAGGTLVNLAAALVFWLPLRSVKNASMPMRYFLLITCAFNLFTGTGYFFFFGVTNFGDWAVVISGLSPHWLWRVLLVIVGVASYYAAMLLVGTGLVRYVGIPQESGGDCGSSLLFPTFRQFCWRALRQCSIRSEFECCGCLPCPQRQVVRVGCYGCSTTSREEPRRNERWNNSGGATLGLFSRGFWRSHMSSYWDVELRFIVDRR